MRVGKIVEMHVRVSHFSKRWSRWWALMRVMVMIICIMMTIRVEVIVFVALKMRY